MIWHIRLLLRSVSMFEETILRTTKTRKGLEGFAANRRRQRWIILMEQTASEDVILASCLEYCGLVCLREVHGLGDCAASFVLVL